MILAIQYQKNETTNIPTILSQVVRFEGEYLDWNNLSTEDLNDLIKDTEAVHYLELDPEVIELTAQEIYKATFKTIPNIIYTPEDFCEEVLYLSNMKGYEDMKNYETVYKLIRRPELKNKLIIISADDLTFPAYRNEEGKVEVINSDLIKVITYDKIYLDTSRALDALAEAALNIPENMDNNVIIETISVSDLEK